MSKGVALAALLASATIGCSDLPNASLPPLPNCHSCFRDLPVALTPIPGTKPEQRRLDRDLTFVDGAGLVWKAIAGDVTDGASIPEVFLAITGPRFEPDFLPAAIVHDHYTDKGHLVREWWAAARMFYEAMRANGTVNGKAKLMYYAVFVFGPHWSDLDAGTPCGPNCIELAPRQTLELRRGRASSFGHGRHFYFQAASASARDVPEIIEMRAQIDAAEAGGHPLSLGEIESEAFRRHPENVFLAEAARLAR